MFTLTKVGLRKIVINRRGVALSQQLARSTVVSNDSTEYQFIEISKLPTLHFQLSLPRLPIPKLEDTCRRYLNAQKPLLEDNKLENTLSCVSKFLANEGQSLHKQLLEYDAKNSHTSYISGPWFDMYLRDRKPLPINYNPCLIFVPESDPKYDTQLVKATNVIISSLRFMKSLQNNVLEPEVFHLNPKKSDTDLFRNVTRLIPPKFSYYGAYLFKAYPLDMSQYKNLFNTSRIPELEKDRIVHEPSNHLVVLRNGYFYMFDVLDTNGYIRSPKEIAACLKTVLEDNRPPNKHPISVFTTSERDQWARTRAHLVETGNQEILKKIDSAIFIMILDDEIIEDTDNNKIMKTFLHSDGTNRWFDKSFTFIVSKNGITGINFEHSWGDGVAVLRFFQDVKADVSKKPKFHPHEVDELPKGNVNVEKLQFNIDTKTENLINQEKLKFQEYINRLCIDHIIFENYGKDQYKTLGISPDAMMQLAFQLAFYTLEGKLVSTYESCSTAAFKHGRTETIRPCTLATKAICAAITQKKIEISKSELKKMILDCSKAHGVLTREAVMGQGFDRHLFALKKIADEANRKVAIFQDPAYNSLNHVIISTSTLSSPVVRIGGFGPVVPDGYGIGYMMQDKRSGAIVTAYKDNRNSSEYVQTLAHAFKSIHDVLHS